MKYNIILVKWGDKFSSEHVNRIYRMAKRNLTLPFSMYCYTEDATGIYDSINIIKLDESLSLEKWWWKLTLFKKNKLPKGINLFLDLDVIIQNNIDHLFDQAVHNKLTLIDTSLEDRIGNKEWLNMQNDDRLRITAAAWNSSIMIWHNNENELFYNKLISNKDFYTKFYAGIDRFFTYEFDDSNFIALNENDYYWRGIELKDSEHRRVKIKTSYGSQTVRVYYNPDKSVCIFNGCHQDYFYQGMENYLL